MDQDEKTWSVPLNGIHFQSEPLETSSSKIMLDTGLTYALAPKSDVDSIAKAL